MAFHGTQTSIWLRLIAITLCLYGVRNEDFLAQFQTEIDQIPNDLDALIVHIDQKLNPESETSSSVQPLRLCVPSTEEYLEFWNIIDRFDANVDNPAVTIVQSTECTESDEIDKLKLWILQIKNDFYELLKQPTWSNAYVDMKISYENQLRRYPKHIDEVGKKVRSDRGQLAMSQLRIDYKSMEAKIKSFFDALQQKKRQENDKAADRCVAELKTNRIASAVKIFNDIAEERIARHVIVKAYQNEDSFQRLFDFIQLLGNSAATQYAYQGLFMKMASKGQFRHINSLIFLNGIEKHKGPEYATISNVLRVKLKPFFQAADYADFYVAVNSRIGGATDFGRDIMPTFVHGAYNSNVGNVAKMLDMQNQFYYMRHKLQLIDALIIEMKIQDHTDKSEFFMVLSDLIDLKAKVYKESNENDKTIVKEVYDNVPSNLLPLLDTNLCIQNSETGEYMYADSVATKQREIFTSNHFDDTFNFEVVFVDRGRSLLFKNVRFAEYLYAVDGETPRKLISMKGLENDKRAHFTIEVVDSINIRIKNVQFNEFLFSTQSSDKNRRIVESKSNVAENGLWKLMSCPEAEQ